MTYFLHDIFMIIKADEWAVFQIGGHHYSLQNRLCRIIVTPVVNEGMCVESIEDPSWATYKKEDGHQRDGFMQFCMRLAECKTP